MMNTRTYFACAICLLLIVGQLSVAADSPLKESAHAVKTKDTRTGTATMPVASLDPTGMAKPIANLRDYNGTYFGASGTGTIGYTTLYRDNEDGGAVSGCNGEGCGRHPAVDIPVTSGTPVYASLGGTVVRSECN